MSIFTLAFDISVFFILALSLLLSVREADLLDVPDWLMPATLTIAIMAIIPMIPSTIGAAGILIFGFLAT